MNWAKFRSTLTSCGEVAKNASALAYAQGGLQEDPEFVEQVLLLGFRDVDVRKASTKRSQKAILKSVGDQKAALKFD